MTPRNSQAYLTAQVNTGDRMDLVLALYEAAIANLTRAMEAVESGDTEARTKALDKTSKIVTLLSESLDYTQPGTLAGDLFSTYNFALQQMLVANRENDVEPLQVVKSTFSVLLDGWKQAAESPEGMAARRSAEAEIVPAGRDAATAGSRARMAMMA